MNEKVEVARDAARIVALPARVQAALGALVGAAQEGAYSRCLSGLGLGVLLELLEEEATEVVGPRVTTTLKRSAVRHGHEAGEVTLGTRRVLS